MEEIKKEEKVKGSLPKPICDIAAGLIDFIDQMDQQKGTHRLEPETKDILYYDDNKNRRKKKIQR